MWSLKIFQIPLYKKLHSKSCCYLEIIYMKKASLKGKANEILTACVLFVICIHVPALHSSYTALSFSQSEARKFVVYIFSVGNNMILSTIWCYTAHVNFSETTKLHLWYNFTLVLHEKWTHFQPIRCT